MVSTRYTVEAIAKRNTTIEHVERFCTTLRGFGVDTDSDSFQFCYDGSIKIDGLIYEQAVRVLKVIDKYGFSVGGISIPEEFETVYDSEEQTRSFNDILDIFKDFDEKYLKDDCEEETEECSMEDCMGEDDDE